MIRFICNYLRGCCCKHDFELIAHVKIADYFRGEKVICGERNTYRCKSVGSSKRSTYNFCSPIRV